MASKVQGFKIDSLLIKDEKLRPKSIPAGYSGARTDISLLKEEDLALLHFLFVKYFDIDGNGLYDSEEQYCFGPEITPKDLYVLNNKLWERSLIIKKLILELQSGNRARMLFACKTLADMRPPAKEATGYIAKYAMPLLMEKFKSKNLVESGDAADLLMNFYWVSAPELIKIVRRGETLSLRVKAAYLLDIMWYYDKDMMKVFKDGYKKGDIDTKIKSVYGLGRAGVFDRENAKTLLNEARKSADMRLKDAAEFALKELKETKKEDFKIIKPVKS